jgi:hypothetical protein
MLLLLLSIAITLTFTPSICSANDQRPFWTEQASFTFDNTLYAIGVATNATSVEAGRQAAFEHGLDEIRNYGQVASLDGLLIETQMTFEQPQSDGRVSVWRLLRVSMGDLRVVKNSQSRQLEVVSRRKPIAPEVAAEVAAEAATVASGRNTSTHEPPSVEPVQIARYRSRRTATQAVSLPVIPLRYPQIITGWTQDTHGRIGVAWQDRQEWYVPVLKASDLTYSPLLNPR